VAAGLALLSWIGSHCRFDSVHGEEKRASFWPMAKVAVAGTGVASGRPGLSPGWPLYVVLLGFPLWWLLGLGGFIWPIVLIPLALGFLMRDGIVVPRGFGLWLLFLILMLGSSIMLDEPHRWIVWLYRFSIYASATILFIYIFNSPERTLPMSKVIGIVTGFWAIVVVGGVLGLIIPDVSFRSPVEMIMPAQLLRNSFVYELVHPGFAEVQTFLGYPIPRPKAPFIYTNEWGANMALLTPFAIAFLYGRRSAFRKLVVAALLIVSVIPMIVSANRGLWLSLSIGLIYGAVRLAARGKGRALGAVLVFIGLSIGLVLTSPLRGLVEDRLATPHSNRARLALYEEATEGVLESPLLGYGAPRPSERSADSPPVGSHGQFWIVLYSHGIPAAIFFVGWLFWAFISSRKNDALWTHVVLLIALIQLPFYGMLPVPIHIIMLAAALAWREHESLAGPGVGVRRYERAPLR
jgi:polysaccharide biosynthesis protein PslJ